MDKTTIRLFSTILLVLMIWGVLYSIGFLTSKDYSFVSGIAFVSTIVIPFEWFMFSRSKTMKERLITTLTVGCIGFPLGTYLFHLFADLGPDASMIIAHYKSASQIITALLFFGLYEMSEMIDQIQTKDTSSAN